MVNKNLNLIYFSSLLECRITSADISWEPFTHIENKNDVQYRIILGKNSVIFFLNLNSIFEFKMIFLLQ